MRIGTEIPPTAPRPPSSVNRHFRTMLGCGGLPPTTFQRPRRGLKEECEAKGTELPTGDLKKRATRARATALAQAFLAALQEDNIIEVFSSAGNRFIEVATKEEMYEEAYSKCMQNPSTEELM